MMEIMQVAVVLLVFGLFLIGTATVVGALTGCETPQESAKRSRAEIEHIASEGVRAMDYLSEQYLEEVYDQVTRTTANTRR